MKLIETKTAIVDFLVMVKEKSPFTEERKAWEAPDIDVKRDHVVKSFLKNNRVVKLKKSSNPILQVDGTNISVTVEKSKNQNQRTTFTWIISAPDGEEYRHVENNSEIVKNLAGSITALKRNNH